MTNNITEAVRRIRQLQQDVDRLKSGGDEGEVRELRDIDEIVDTVDQITIGPDALADETTASADATAVGPDALADETTDSLDDAVSRVRRVNAVNYDTATFDTDDYA